MTGVYTASYTVGGFSWDERRSVDNLNLRGFDFAFAVRIFGGVTLEREDTRCDYGERRVIAVGMVEGRELTVVYTDRQILGLGIGRRIISARRSNRHERQAYQRQLAQG